MRPPPGSATGNNQYIETVNYAENQTRELTCYTRETVIMSTKYPLLLFRVPRPTFQNAYICECVFLLRIYKSKEVAHFYCTFKK